MARMTQAEVEAHQARISRKQAIHPRDNRLRLVLKSQIQGGKNNIGITRSGHRYPKPNWAKWRDEMIAQVKSQLPNGWKPIDTFSTVDLYYVAGDKRRRDMPAIIDAIWHVLEKSGVVVDDTLLWVASSHREFKKNEPIAFVVIERGKDE